MSPVLWLALAATQWKCGRLEPHVLQQALEAIDSGSDLASWDAGSRDQKKRQAVLQKLRAQLVSPQPLESAASATRSRRSVYLSPVAFFPVV